MQVTARTFVNPPSEVQTPSPVGERTKKNLETTGKVLVATGVGGAVVFFSAPVSIPVLAATAVLTLVIQMSLDEDPRDRSDSSSRSKCEAGVCYGLIFGAGTGTIVGRLTWNSIKDFVYDAQVAKIALIFGAAITGLGIVSWGLSRCIQLKPVNDSHVNDSHVNDSHVSDSPVSDSPVSDSPVQGEDLTINIQRKPVNHIHVSDSPVREEDFIFHNQSDPLVNAAVSNSL